MSVLVSSKFPAMLGERRLKISTVSKETGISRTTLTDLYYGRRSSISFEVLDKLCDYLSCSMGDIIEHRPNIKPEGKETA